MKKASWLSSQLAFFVACASQWRNGIQCHVQVRIASTDMFAKNAFAS